MPLKKRKPSQLTLGEFNALLEALDSFMTNSTDDDDDEETQHFLTLLQKVRGKLTHRCFLAVLYCSIRKVSPNSGYTPLASNLKKAPQAGQGLKEHRNGKGAVKPFNSLRR